MTSARDELAAIHTFPQLVRYLRDELDWPVTSDDFEDLVFDYAAEDLGIDAHNAAKIQEIKRLRPLSANQPWGIFFVKFEPKRLPVVALRRILSGVALKKRASAQQCRPRCLGGLRPPLHLELRRGRGAPDQLRPLLAGPSRGRTCRL